MNILANLRFLKIEDPDWKVKYASGLRTNINYGTDNFSCAVAFDREIEQGESVDCEISFLTHEPHVGKLEEGKIQHVSA